VPDVFEPQGTSESIPACQLVELTSHQVVDLAYIAIILAEEITLSAGEAVVMIEISLAWFLIIATVEFVLSSQS